MAIVRLHDHRYVCLATSPCAIGMGVDHCSSSAMADSLQQWSTTVGSFQSSSSITEIAEGTIENFGIDFAAIEPHGVRMVPPQDRPSYQCARRRDHSNWL